MKLKYLDRLWMIISGPVIIPIFLFVTCVILPCYWLIRFNGGWKIFIDDVKTGYFLIYRTVINSWVN